MALLELKVKNLGSVRDKLARLSGPQIRTAYAGALNDVAFKLRKAQQDEISASFDRPTNYITRSPQVAMATPDKLSVAIGPDVRNKELWASGGKQGVSPQKILQAEEWGGARADKKSEVALRRAGILPAGYQTAIPSTPYPGSDDGHGNLRGAFVAQLLSYLQLSGEQGFKQNMKDKARRKLEGARAYSDIRTRKIRTARDQRFFVSYGKLRANRSSHLAPGIWAATGPGGAIVQPVLMFVRAGTYQPRIKLSKAFERTDMQDYLDRRFRARIHTALGD